MLGSRNLFRCTTARFQHRMHEYWLPRRSVGRCVHADSFRLHSVLQKTGEIKRQWQRCSWKSAELSEWPSVGGQSHRQEAIADRSVFEISATVFDTLSGLSLSAK